jgi:hypothetical protein
MDFSISIYKFARTSPFEGQKYACCIYRDIPLHRKVIFFAKCMEK